MQSESINELAAALSKAQGEFAAIPKTETNPFFKSKYAGLPDVIGAASKTLAANGLSVSQFITRDELGSEVLKTYLLHSSGQYIEHDMSLHLGKLDSQGQGSAVTYARRYSYMSVLGLVADEDDDGNKASRPAVGGTGIVWYDTTSPPPTFGDVTADGEIDPRIDAILKAAEQGENTFLMDLATKYAQYGKLSDKQLEAGFKQAAKILTTSRSAPTSEGGYADVEERF
jgi:hypothetical protein